MVVTVVSGRSYKLGEKIDSYIFGADPGLPQQSDSSEVSLKNDKKRTVYRCKKCRRVIALQANVVSHAPGEGKTCFDWQKRKSHSPFNRFDESECSSIFFEPLRWMTAVEEGALEGKLSCIHFEARLGYFNWFGIQCNCGSWITPAFQIQKGRVDVSTLRRAGSRKTMRRLVRSIFGAYYRNTNIRFMRVLSGSCSLVIGDRYEYTKK